MDFAPFGKALFCINRAAPAHHAAVRRAPATGLRGGFAPAAQPVAVQSGGFAEERRMMPRGFGMDN